MAEKTESLLAALRGLPPPEAPPAADAAAAPAATEEQLAPLRSKIDELERKLAEMAAPPPPAEEELTPPEPPKPPTELTLFLHTRVELLERRLELAQQEALRANLVLREREEAQRKAQKEVEELFKTLREQERTARFDKRLREQTAATQARVEDMGARLAMAELKMIPAEEVLAWLEKEGSLEAVRERLDAEAEAERGVTSPSSGGGYPTGRTSCTSGAAAGTSTGWMCSWPTPSAAP